MSTSMAVIYMPSITASVFTAEYLNHDPGHIREKNEILRKGARAL